MNFETDALVELRKVNRSLEAIAGALQKIANPPVTVGTFDRNAGPHLSIRDISARYGAE